MFNVHVFQLFHHNTKQHTQTRLLYRNQQEVESQLAFDSFAGPMIYFCARKSSNCRCFSAIALSKPAALSASRYCGIVSSGSTEPVSSAASYVLLTFANEAASVLIGLTSNKNPSAGEYVPPLLNSLNCSHLS